MKPCTAGTLCTKKRPTIVGTPQKLPGKVCTSFATGTSVAMPVMRSRPQASVCTNTEPSGPTRGSSGLMWA